MMPAIALFFRVILRLNVFVLPKFVLFLNKCSAVYSWDAWTTVFTNGRPQAL